MHKPKEGSLIALCLIMIITAWVGQHTTAVPVPGLAMTCLTYHSTDASRVNFQHHDLLIYILPRGLVYSWCATPPMLPSHASEQQAQATHAYVVPQSAAEPQAGIYSVSPSQAENTS